MNVEPRSPNRRNNVGNAREASKIIVESPIAQVVELLACIEVLLTDVAGLITGIAKQRPERR